MVDLESINAQQDAVLRRLEARQAQALLDAPPKPTPPPPPILTAVGTERHLVLGNGPSLSLHDLEAIQKRPEVTTYGVNRLPIVPD